MYITNLDWSQPEQVAEAYTLLDNLKEPISLAVSIVLMQLSTSITTYMHRWHSSFLIQNVQMSSFEHLLLRG